MGESWLFRWAGPVIRDKRERALDTGYALRKRVYALRESLQCTFDSIHAHFDAIYAAALSQDESG